MLAIPRLKNVIEASRLINDWIALFFV